MKELKEKIFNRIVDILIANPNLFPIIGRLLTAEKNEKLEESRIYYEVENLIGLKFIFNHYFDILEGFWYVGDNHFKDNFEKMVIEKVITHYKYRMSTNPQQETTFTNLIKSL